MIVLSAIDVWTGVRLVEGADEGSINPARTEKLRRLFERIEWGTP